MFAFAVSLAVAAACSTGGVAIYKGAVAVSVQAEQVDPAERFRPNDRVTVYGVFALPGKAPRLVAVLEYAQVLVIEGFAWWIDGTESGARLRGGASGSLLPFAVRMPSQKTATELVNVMTHAIGHLAVRHSRLESGKKPPAIRIAPELRRLGANSKRQGDAESKAKPEAEGIPLLLSSLPAFDLAGRLHDLGIGGTEG